MPVDEAMIAALEGLFPEGDWVEEINDEPRTRERLARLRELAEPGFAVEMIGPGGFTGSFEGIEGFEEAWRDWLHPFESYRVELEPEIRTSDDAAVFFADQVVTPRGGEHPIESEGAMVAFFSDRKLRRIEFHLDRARALRSAGLAE